MCGSFRGLVQQLGFSLKLIFDYLHIQAATWGWCCLQKHSAMSFHEALHANSYAPLVEDGCYWNRYLSLEYLHKRH
jgi:hypothetical protein